MGVHRGTVALLMCLAACRRTQLPSRPSDVLRTEAMLSKLTTYSHCLETHAARVFEIADIYRDQFKSTAPRDAELVVPATEDPLPCVLAIAIELAGDPPMPDLEAAGQAFGAALLRVNDLTWRVHGYLDRSDPSFAPAKAAALHTDLMAAFADFDRTEAALFDQLYRVNRTMQAELLARDEAREGRTISLIAGDMMYRAEDLVAKAAVPFSRLDTIDTAAFASELTSIEGLIAELEAVADTAPKDVEHLTGFWPFVAHAQVYAHAARELLTRAVDHVAYSDTENLAIAAHAGRTVVGTPDAVVDSYNDLVAAYPVDWSPKP